jgi:hypothetical protein
MVLVVLRVWLDDRPGSLASVAGRIGAMGGDVIGIDVLERGAGRVIDEFVVELTTKAPTSGRSRLLKRARKAQDESGESEQNHEIEELNRLVTEIDHLDGVNVEVAEVVPELPDPRLDALELATALVSAATGEKLLDTLVEESCHRFGCGWAAVVDRARSAQIAASGPAPHASWLAAFVTGVSSTGGDGPVDVAWAALAGTGLVLVLGRDQSRFRERERRQITALAQIAAIRFVQSGAEPSAPGSKGSFGRVPVAPGPGPSGASGTLGTSMASRIDQGRCAHPSWGDRSLRQVVQIPQVPRVPKANDL